MKFIDSVKIDVKAGKGGDGMIAFRREAHVDKGGPSGGDGGDGGDIYFIADKGKNTLLHLYYLKHIKGNDGVNGGPKNLYGARGEDTYIKVPLGTVVYDENDNLIADVIDSDFPYLIAKGGRGGRGNAKFKTAKNKAPRLNELGLDGESKKLRLVLKVLADVGFVGLPNAGKSTILSQISNAKAKISDYAFTTLVPQLGMVKYDDASFAVADLPGLIKGASEGKGLGLNFLQHIERCRLIAHVIDFGSLDKDPINDYLLIRNELAQYDEELLKRGEIIIANKSDLESFKQNLEIFKQKFPDLEVVEIAALYNRDINKLKGKIAAKLATLEEVVFKTEFNAVLDVSYVPDYEIKKNFDGDYDISGSKVEYWYNRIPLTTDDNWRRFNLILKNMGIWEQLTKEGIKEGDTVRIFSHEFTWSSRDF
ncbi:GTPase ObgE [Mycoplasmopsis agassizii]|uniref:GTPase ObgE n=1 Tax=Mycoplasmopsis agassizii TaxID=33922 RepID=UPI003527B98D